MDINDNVYGRQEISDPLALEIIATPEMQRLKGVNQYGVWHLLEPKYFTSRFDHCVGVYLLLRHLHASREEQVAGLIHDIAHTAFSHVIDYVFNQEESQAVHETFHRKVIFGSEIPEILSRHGLDVERVANEHNYGLLERDLPDLCADRLDYFLRDTLLLGINSLEDCQEVVGSLKVHDNMIMMDNVLVAKKAAHRFIETCQQFWASPLQAGSYTVMGGILKEALAQDIIVEKDFFLTDAQLIEKLQAFPEMQGKLQLLSLEKITLGTKEDHTLHGKSKARYIDPQYINSQYLTNGSSGRVTDIFPELQKRIDVLVAQCREGYYIKVCV